MDDHFVPALGHAGCHAFAAFPDMPRFHRLPGRESMFRPDASGKAKHAFAAHVSGRTGCVRDWPRKHGTLTPDFTRTSRPTATPCTPCWPPPAPPGRARWPAAPAYTTRVERAPAPLPFPLPGGPEPCTRSFSSSRPPRPPTRPRRPTASKTATRCCAGTKPPCRRSRKTAPRRRWPPAISPSSTPRSTTPSTPSTGPMRSTTSPSPRRPGRRWRRPRPARPTAF